MNLRIWLIGNGFIGLTLLCWQVWRGQPIAAPVEKIPQLQPKGYVCYRARQPITIDGQINENEWKDAPWSESFEDIEGNSKRPKPRFRTRMRMLWDEKNLYIAATIEDPHIWATLKQHDSVIFQDNDFEVFINPEGDNHLYAELEINALNTTWDLLLPKPYKDGGRAIDAWEIPGLRTAVHIDGTLNNSSDTDRSWSVEIAWPWKSLKELTKRAVPPDEGDQWRINFSRVEWKHSIVAGKYRKIEGTKEDNWVWSPQGVIDMHRPETWGYVQFSLLDPGKSKFLPDSTEPVRHALHQVYYAQTEYRKQHKTWAKTLDDLGLADLKNASFAPVELQLTDHDFEASVKLRSADKKLENWHINSESRIRKD